MCIMGGAYSFLVFPHQNKYNVMKEQKRNIELKLLATKAERTRLNELVYDLDHNPIAIEKVAREKFGLCKVNEGFYRF